MDDEKHMDLNKFMVKWKQKEITRKGMSYQRNEQISRNLTKLTISKHVNHIMFAKLRQKYNGHVNKYDMHLIPFINISHRSLQNK